MLKLSCTAKNILNSSGSVRQTFRAKSLQHTSRCNFAMQQFDPKKDYYKVLGVSSSATPADIKKSFYALAKKYHPDVNKGSDLKFKEINEAYDILSDSIKKKDYDDARKYGAGQQTSGYSQSSNPYTQNTYGGSYYGNANKNAYQQQNYKTNPYGQNSGFSNQQKSSYYYQQNTYRDEDEMRKYFRDFYGNKMKDFSERMGGMGSNGKYQQQQMSQKEFEEMINKFNERLRMNMQQQYDQYGQAKQEQERKTARESYEQEQYEIWRKQRENEKFRKQTEEEFMKEAEKAYQNLMGKVDGAKKILKNIGSGFGNLFNNNNKKDEQFY